MLRQEVNLIPPLFDPETPMVIAPVWRRRHGYGDLVNAIRRHAYFFNARIGCRRYPQV